MSRISEIALAFKERGGKRLRPRLCKAVFEACRNAPGAGGGDIAAVCDAVECFHKASLIHDDIQDGDETRYGRPTTWREHGVAVAIAAGGSHWAFVLADGSVKVYGETDKGQGDTGQWKLF